MWDITNSNGMDPDSKQKSAFTSKCLLSLPLLNLIALERDEQRQVWRFYLLQQNRPFQKMIQNIFSPKANKKVTRNPTPHSIFCSVHGWKHKVSQECFLEVLEEWTLQGHNVHGVANYWWWQGEILFICRFSQIYRTLLCSFKGSFHTKSTKIVSDLRIKVSWWSCNIHYSHWMMSDGNMCVLILFSCCQAFLCTSPCRSLISTQRHTHCTELPPMRERESVWVSVWSKTLAQAHEPGAARAADVLLVDV